MDAKAEPGRIPSAILAWMLALGCLAPGCAFVESASELTFGEPDIPAVENESVFTIEIFNQAIELAAAEFEAAGGGAITERDLEDILLDAVIDKDKMIDVRGNLCRADLIGLVKKGTLDIPIELSDSQKASDAGMVDLRLRLQVPYQELGVACLQSPLRAGLVIDFVPFSADQAQKMRGELGSAASEAELKRAIVQIRFLFNRLEFRRMEDGEQVEANDALSDIELSISDLTIPDDPATPFEDGRYKLVPFFLLETISPETPQRFELDPDSPVTDSIKSAIVVGDKGQQLEIVAMGELRDDELLPTLLQGSGVVIDMQPEFVISALALVESEI